MRPTKYTKFIIVRLFRGKKYRRNNAPVTRCMRVPLNIILRYKEQIFYFREVACVYRRNITVAFGRTGLTLTLQHLQSVDDSGAGILRLDDHVDHTAHGGLIWRGKVIDIFLSLSFNVGVSSLKIIFAAPAGPITATSEVGQAMT